MSWKGSKAVALTTDALLIPASSDLPGRQTRASTALLAASSVAGAAREARIGERTLRRWLQEDPQFRTFYRRARSEMLAQATTRLQFASMRAVETLCELLNERSRPEVRARVALGILAFAARGEELEGLAVRVDTLEMAAANRLRGE